MFQLKKKHNIIYTRDKLFRAKIVENNNCQSCGIKQTQVHLFVECQYVNRGGHGDLLCCGVDVFVMRWCGE